MTRPIKASAMPPVKATGMEVCTMLRTFFFVFCAERCRHDYAHAYGKPYEQIDYKIYYSAGGAYRGHAEAAAVASHYH